MTQQIKPVRRLITIDDGPGVHAKSRCIADGPSPDVRTDPARPGFSSTRIWVTDRSPARIEGITETLNTPHTLEPPPGGSVCRVVTFPPEARYPVGAKEVRAYFNAMGSPGASTYSNVARHPYMQKTRTLDFCLILEGEITLVLDKQDVSLKTGDSVVQRGTNHAWRNHSDKPCTIAFSSHDGIYC